MLFLLHVLVSTCLAICFKIFAQKGINTFNAIVFNYTFCLILGSCVDPQGVIPFTGDIVQRPWFKYSMVLGIMFITGFTLTAYAVQTAGITLNAMAQRMSILLTVPITVLLFGEHFGLLELTGLFFAVAAIIAINRKGSSDVAGIPYRGSIALIAVLLTSAAVELYLLFLDRHGLAGQDQLAVTSYGFGAAGITGWIILTFLWIFRRHRIAMRDILGGAVLSIPNFLSIFLILVMLKRGWHGSILYPLVNVGVLLCSALVAVGVFRERLSRMNWLGIGLASLAILIIGFAHYSQL